MKLQVLVITIKNQNSNCSLSNQHHIMYIIIKCKIKHLTQVGITIWQIIHTNYIKEFIFKVLNYILLNNRFLLKVHAFIT